MWFVVEQLEWGGGACYYDTDTDWEERETDLHEVEAVVIVRKQQNIAFKIHI